MKLLKLSMNINHKTAFLQFSVKTDILIRTQIRVITFRSGKLIFTCIWIWKLIWVLENSPNEAILLFFCRRRETAGTWPWSGGKLLNSTSTQVSSIQNDRIRA